MLARPPGPLAPLFLALLASLTAPGCWNYRCDLPPTTHVKQLPAGDLAPHLLNGVVRPGQCEVVCEKFIESSDADTGTASGTGTDSYEYTYFGFFRGCSKRTIDAATIELTCYYDSGAVCGRRPAGATGPHAPASPDPELAWLLAAAELEAMSVPAFDELAAELARHGAPEQLRAAARRAADDERRHAATIGALVRTRGHEPGAPPVEPAPPVDLEALAVHNAVEGCVRETWGALLAAFQARNATAADMRAAQLEIAEDERAHAELAWQIDAWARTRLSAAAQARVDAARRDAAQALAREIEGLGVGLPALGLPNASQARALVRGLQAALW